MSGSARPSYEGSIITVFGGGDIPEKLLDTYLTNLPTVFGASIASMEKDKPPTLAAITTPFSEMEDPKAGVLEFLEQFKSKDRVLFFGNYPDGYKEADIQPYPLLVNGEGTPLAVAFLIGNFSEDVDEPIVGCSDAWSLFEDRLRPKIVDIFESQGYDLDKFATRIKDHKITAREIGELGDNGACIIIMTANDKIIHFGEKDSATDFEWGWTTNPFDYTEEPAKAEEPAKTPEPEVPPKKLSIVEQMKLKAAAGKSMATQVHTTDTKSAPLNEKKPTSVPDTKSKHPEGGTKVETDLVMWAPDQTLNRANAKAAYLAHLQEGHRLPKDWDRKPYQSILIKVPKTVKSFQELKGTTAAKAPPADVKKDTTLHVVNKNSGEKNAGPALDPKMPVIPTTERNAIEDFLKGVTVAFLDKKTEAIMDPVVIKHMEDKLPTFSDQVGIPGLETAFRWSYNELCTLGNASVSALALCAKTAMNQLIRKAQEDFIAKQVDLKKPEAEVVEKKLSIVERMKQKSA